MSRFRENHFSQILFVLAQGVMSIAGLMGMFPFCLYSAIGLAQESPQPFVSQGALQGHRHRVIVSTDIGGTDPDDFQSMVHLLLYADCLDIEGLVSSPYGPGRKEHILQVIDHYQSDFNKLKTHSTNYPTAESLRDIAKQGAIESAGFQGWGTATEGSNWIVERARAQDSRPLYVLVWGGLEDLAQALHDAPDILPKLRVYWIGGPNKKWSVHSYCYLVKNHPHLWFIEANSTYRGWFIGGDQSNAWGNKEFVSKHVAGKGALGDYFAEHLSGTIKMGDSPSVAWLLSGVPSQPKRPSWGGQFVPSTQRQLFLFERLPLPEDRIGVFDILELALPLPKNIPQQFEVRLVIENQSIAGHLADDHTLRFRFCPKEARTFNYALQSNLAEFDGKSGSVTAVADLSESSSKQELITVSTIQVTNWWVDSPDPQLRENGHCGARSVSQWRREFLTDFAKRMQWCQD